MDIMEVMKKISEYMKSKGISQRRMAIDLNVTEGTISYWLHGTKEPTLYHFAEMLDYLGLDIDLKEKR